jgi:hypothetical protein
MRSLPRRAAAVLVGLSIAATAFEAGAQVALERAPLKVAAPFSPADPPVQDTPSAGIGVLAASLVGLALTDVGFGIYEGIEARRGQHPTSGVGIAEAVVFTPQALAFGTVQAVYASVGPGEDKEAAGIAAVPVSAFVYATLVHAVVNEKLPTARTGVLYGASWAAGVDLALTVPVLAAASQHRLFPRALGGVELALTAPQIAVASYGLVKDGRNAAGWASLAGCSGALFVHGLLSIAVPRREPPADAPPPPRAPKRPLLVPSSIDFGPARMQGGAGIGVSGRWG